MKRVEGKVVIGLIVLMIGTLAPALARTSNPAKASAKTNATSTAAASSPGASHPTDTPPAAGASPMIAPPGWVPQNLPAQPSSQAAPVKAAQKKSLATQPHGQTAKPAHAAVPKN